MNSISVNDGQSSTCLRLRRPLPRPGKSAWYRHTWLASLTPCAGLCRGRGSLPGTRQTWLASLTPRAGLCRGRGSLPGTRHTWLASLTPRAGLCRGRGSLLGTRMRWDLLCTWPNFAGGRSRPKRALDWGRRDGVSCRLPPSMNQRQLGERQVAFDDNADKNKQERGAVGHAPDRVVDLWPHACGEEGRGEQGVEGSRT